MILQIIGNVIMLGAALFLIYKGSEHLIEWGHHSIDDRPPFPWLGPIDVVVGGFVAAFSLFELIKLLS